MQITKQQGKNYSKRNCYQASAPQGSVRLAGDFPQGPAQKARKQGEEAAFYRKQENQGVRKGEHFLSVESPAQFVKRNQYDHLR